MTPLLLPRMRRTGTQPGALPAPIIGKGALGVLLALLVGGCAMMPAPGPLAENIKEEASDDEPSFVLVTVTPATVDTLRKSPHEDLASLATNQPAPLQRIRVGDVLSITLWEYGSGLLGPVSVGQSPGTGSGIGLAGAQSATLPNQTVDQTGYIMVPFAGDVRAAGLTSRELQQRIVAALRGKSNDAQVLVNVVQTTDNAASVTGDVAHPGRFPLALSGTRILDAISMAGGATDKARNMIVQLTRDNTVRRARLSGLLADPDENIYLKPNDVITLDHEPQSVVLLGAINRNAEIPFDKSRITLAEAIGNGGGLKDEQANPYGVYVLRREPVALTRMLSGKDLPAGLIDHESVPVIYHVNLRTADGLFLAQSFALEDRDVVYVANSPTVQLYKVVRLLSTASTIVKKNSYNGYSY